MITTSQIKPDASVLGSDKVQLATVDHLEGPENIKLKKDAQGVHHYIPMSWVKTVDGSIHLDRPREQAMSEWSTTPPLKNSDVKTSAKQ